MGLLDGRIVVYCGGLESIDAAGLAVLAQAARDHDGLTLREATPTLARLVKLTELADVLRVSDATTDEPSSV